MDTDLVFEIFRDPNARERFHFRARHRRVGIGLTTEKSAPGWVTRAQTFAALMLIRETLHPGIPVVDLTQGVPRVLCPRRGR